MDRSEKPKPAHRSEFANEAEILRPDPAEMGRLLNPAVLKYFAHCAGPPHAN
jgi:hypothetical protein